MCLADPGLDYSITSASEITMRRPRFVFAVMPLLMAFTCDRNVYSVHPFFSEAESADSTELIGVWAPVSGDRGNQWILFPSDSSSGGGGLTVVDSATAFSFLKLDSATASKGDSATIAMLEAVASGTGSFDARAGRLSGMLFLDLARSDPHSSSPLGRDLVIPAHWIWRATVDGDRLRITPLNEEWLEKMLDSGTVRIAHEREKGRRILTAQTADLQRLVTQYARDTAAFQAKTTIELQRTASAQRVRAAVLALAFLPRP